MPLRLATNASVCVRWHEAVAWNRSVQKTCLLPLDVCSSLRSRNKLPKSSKKIMPKYRWQTCSWTSWQTIENKTESRAFKSRLIHQTFKSHCRKTVWLEMVKRMSFTSANTNYYWLPGLNIVFDFLLVSPNANIWYWANLCEYSLMLSKKDTILVFQKYGFIFIEKELKLSDKSFRESSWNAVRSKCSPRPTRFIIN